VNKWGAIGQAAAVLNWVPFPNQVVPRPLLAARRVANPLQILTNIHNTVNPNARVIVFLRGDGTYDFSYVFGTGNFPYGQAVLDNPDVP